MKGIVLAGGSGTRLYPVTQGISKQLVPVYDKPMVYYPVSVLMLAGITDILIISTPDDISGYQRLLGDGSQLGIKFSYETQPHPGGLAQAFLIGEDFIGDDDVCLVLGDNIFHGHGLVSLLINAAQSVKEQDKAVVFGYRVNDPERYGVAEFNSNGNVISIEEKPSIPKSNYAVTGLYFYPNDVVLKAKDTLPSKRGEIEITSINQSFLSEKRLHVELMGRGYAWLDTGTHESLLEASQFIEIIERRQGLKVACLEEIAFQKGYISKQELISLAEPLKKNKYGKYLLECLKET
tara:strand:- start:1134 stop:2012 length:879 start_codon:yes stop_codon:yes gene_type:complete